MKKVVAFALVLAFFSCQKEAPNTPVVIDPTCDKAQFEADLADLIADNHFVLDVDESGEDYVIWFEHGEGLAVCKELFYSYSINEEEWLMTFTYLNGSTLEIPSRGNLEIDLSINPSGYNPLCAKAVVSAPRKGKITLRVVGKDGVLSDLVKEFGEIQTEHEIPIFGLYEDHQNLVELTYKSDKDRVIDIDTIIIQTTKITQFDPKIEIIHRDRSGMEPGEFHLVSTLSFWNPNIVYMFDLYGNVRWMINYSTSPEFNGLLYDVGVERLPNGNFYFGDIGTSTIYEVDMFGELVNSWDMQGYIFHHNVQVKPDGNFLVCAEDPSSVHLSGLGTAEDYVIEIDRQTGEIVKVWDFKQILDENRFVLGEFFDQGNVDWLHINAVIFDPNDETIIISGRHQGLIKVDYQDNVKWIIAPHEGWGRKPNRTRL